MNRMKFQRLVPALALLIAVLAGACASSSEGRPTLIIGGIPDQDVSLLEERFNGIADLLSEELGIDVDYKPSITYSALVAAFQHGDVGLGWFGGLTGVQARIADPGSQAIVQRPRDEVFRSVFIAGPDTAADSLENLAGLSFTFGSESSTSGHLIPRFYLEQAGIDPETDFKSRPSYSGSHDKTWKQVEAGAFQAGALAEAVWLRAVKDGRVDTSRVRVLETTPAYFDYHWVANSRLDSVFGEGTVERIKEILTGLAGSDERAGRILELFQTDTFIETENDNYAAIEQTARQLGLIE